MIKLIITILLPFVAPMIANILWQKFVIKQPVRGMRRSKVAWCFLLGAAFVALSLFIFGLPSNSADVADYQPPIFRDGKIIPGHFD